GRTNALLVEVAPRVVIAQRTLQGHATSRPLLLRVQSRVADAVVAVERLQRLRELIRYAVVHAILEEQVVREGLRVVRVKRTLIAELRVVRAGHIRGRCAPGVRAVPVVFPVERPVREVRDVAVDGAPGRALL